MVQFVKINSRKHVFGSKTLNEGLFDLMKEKNSNKGIYNLYISIILCEKFVYKLLKYRQLQGGFAP